MELPHSICDPRPLLPYAKILFEEHFFLQGFPLRGRLQIAPSSNPNTLDTSDKEVDLRKLKLETPQVIYNASFYKAGIQDAKFTNPVEFNLGRGHVGPGGGNSRGSAGTHLKRSCITNMCCNYLECIAHAGHCTVHKHFA